MKTAISIPDDLFEEIRQLAQDEKTSRSKILTDAVREYMERRKSRKLLTDLNEVYKDLDTPEEKELRQRSRKYYSRRVGREKW